jgi:hypothetical protein
MFKNILYKLNLISQISNLIYSRRVIKEIVVQRAVEEYYYLTDEKGKKLRNPTMVKGSLTLKMPLPPNLDEFQIETYIEDHCKILINTLLSLNLYGIVRFGKKIYINDNYVDESEEAIDYGMVILTISPDYRRVLITMAIYMVLILSILYYVSFFNNWFKLLWFM